MSALLVAKTCGSTMTNLYAQETKLATTNYSAARAIVGMERELTVSHDMGRILDVGDQRCKAKV